MKRLFKYIKSYQWYFIIALTAMMIGIILDMFNPRLLKTVIDEIIIAKKLSLLNRVLLALLGITAGRAVLGYIKEFLFDNGGQKVVTNLRQDLFDSLADSFFLIF